MQPQRSHDSAYWLSGWPALVTEWHPTRNGALQPHEVSHGSGRRIWWRCPHGPDHEWQASPNNRTGGGTGCPFCAGRRVSITNSLAVLRPDLAQQWHPHRNGNLLPEDVVAGSTRRVWWKCRAAPDHEWRVSPHDRWSLEGGCPFCMRLRVCPTNSLAVTLPRIAAEWHPSRNLGLTAEDVVPGSARRVWWRCARHEEHEWRASVSNRALRRSGCPFCAGRKASAQHCLAAAHPDVALQWHPTRNGPLTPTSVTPRARQVAWWLCACGHEWRMRISARTRRGSGCPACRSSSGREDRCKEVAHDLREEHRRIEQILTLLMADPGAEETTLAEFSVDLMAHLEAEARVFYPAVERALRRRLIAHRELRARLLRLLSSLAPSDRNHRGDTLRELRVGFREHVRFEEGVGLPVLESVMDARTLDGLWRKVGRTRVAVLTDGLGTARRITAT